MHAQADTQRKTHTQARISIYWIAKCLHCKVRGSHVFAGAQGLVTLCRYIHMAALFAPCVWAVVGMCVCAQWGLYVCVCVCVCASVWIGVCLSTIKPDRVYPESHIIAVGFPTVPFFILTCSIWVYLSVFFMLCFLMPSCLFLMYSNELPCVRPMALLLHVILPSSFQLSYRVKGTKSPPVILMIIRAIPVDHCANINVSEAVILRWNSFFNVKNELSHPE